MVGNMCAAGAFGPSIAHQIGIVPETLYVRCQQDNGEDFSAFRLRHIQRGDDILRVKQFQVAQAGDKSMLIWLGKQRLGQRDRHELSGSVNYTPPAITINVMTDRNGDPSQPAAGGTDTADD